MSDTVVLHAVWSHGALCVWGESRRRLVAHDGEDRSQGRHPLAVDARALADMLQARYGVRGETGEVAIRMPLAGEGERPVESPRLAHAAGRMARGTGGLELADVRVPVVMIDSARVEGSLDALAGPASTGKDEVFIGQSVEFFVVALRLARHLLSRQRFVPSLRHSADGRLEGLWQAWLGDEPTGELLALLIEGAPAAAFACVDGFEHDPVLIVEDFLTCIVNAACRRVLAREDMAETLEHGDEGDEHVQWLGGLLSERADVRGQAGALVRGVRTWLARLEERGQSTAWRLLLRLDDPHGDELRALDRGEKEAVWRLSFHLQSADAPDIVVQAEDIWLLPPESANVEGRLLERPQELFLAELGRAGRLYAPIEQALEGAEPVGITLSTAGAYQFLREASPILREQGFEVAVPAWWDAPSSRIAARLRVDAPPLEAIAAGGRAGRAGLGLNSLIDFDWEITLGDATLTLAEFEAIANKRDPLIRMNGQWVEVRPDDVRAAARFMRAHGGGNMSLLEAIRLSYGFDQRETGIPIIGMTSMGWVQSLLEKTDAVFEQVGQPAGFMGVLRPYQQRGLSWLAFLERLGLGPCLADDMGLGKTIQVLALLQYEREVEGDVGPTLVVVPLSVVGNWMREAGRFCPQLRVHVHHGPDRARGDAFEARVAGADLVITTYTLAQRDRDTLDRTPWRRIVLDEAQFIKNPRAKQSIAVRSLSADYRLAMTGTPVENRLGELWSIMEFLNPGYLGSAASFEKKFAGPIERRHDEARSRRLRALVQPFLLRRLKTDPAILPELPAKVETRQYAHLTHEQAALYETYVKRMLARIEREEGIRRRGLVLATLVRLKQICNHPASVPGIGDDRDDVAPDPGRSGKCIRLLEILEEVLAENEQSLIFSQFRRMGLMLASIIRHELDREVVVLHGGLSAADRDGVVARFQRGEAPILVASLKAGGLGLNLTAATHVMHFDRWWNPAVENQATDRAYRIGQSRSVQVHKFVVEGTLEEHIDRMIEEKTGLADRIVGSGERWLTELDAAQLRTLLTLRMDAVGAEDELDAVETRE